MLDENDLPHELLMITTQKTKLINAFSNNMSTDIKLSKVQISKIIQSGGFLGSLLSKLAGQLMKVAVTLTKNLKNNRPLEIGKNKKVLSKFKDEVGGKIMTKFVALRAKTYSFLIDEYIDEDYEKNRKVNKKAKGTKKC